MTWLGTSGGRRRWLLGLLLVLGVGAGASGALAAYYLFDDGRQVEQLSDYRASTITRVIGRGDEPIGEFATERRVVLGYRDLPRHLIDAVVAVEDADFYRHEGLNLRGIARAMVRNLMAGRVVEGGSSLTQQLAKLMFLTPERSLKRKIDEAVLALNIERRYSKEEILTLYCNQVYLGHNRYGVEAASRYYFGKHARQLTLAEAALIAGLPQRPEGYSPYRYPEAAKNRRDHVLDRMAAVGSITPDQAERAKAEPLAVRSLEPPATTGSYFLEEVRQKLEATYGVRGLYHDGLTVHTTLDPKLQEAAEKALRDGLLAVDHRHGWHGALSNVLADQPGSSLDDYRHPDWQQPLTTGRLVHGLVTGVGGGAVEVRIGDHRVRVAQLPEWLSRRRLDGLFEVGDIGLFRVLAEGADGRGPEIEIEQEPQVEGALIALDVATGEIRAMVGGWDFARSRFNRAVQARRQTGSAFKPIVYATALANGFTASDRLFDEPIELTDPQTGVVYSPENHHRDFHGLTTVREGLEKSRNPFTVQLLMQVGPDKAIETARRLGLTAPLQPYPSLGLGAFEVSLVEMTAAFAAIADLGTYHPPYGIRRVEDRDGQLLERHDPVGRPALEPDVAFLTTYLLEGVIRDGTGRRAKVLGRPLAGKTGTTDGFTDAWFIGYSPRIACGVWVGRDRKDAIGQGEEGARAALPIWIDFMAAALADAPEEDFVPPPGVEFVMVDKATGLRAGASCSDPFPEAFLRGTAPVQYCSQRDHEILSFPYYLQKLFLADGGPATGLPVVPGVGPVDPGPELARGPREDASN